MNEKVFCILNAMVYFWMLSNIAAILLGHYFKEPFFHRPVTKVLACFVPTLVLGVVLLGITFYPVGTMMFLFIGMIVFMIMSNF